MAIDGCPNGPIRNHKTLFLAGLTNFNPYYTQCNISWPAWKASPLLKILSAGSTSFSPECPGTRCTCWPSTSCRTISCTPPSSCWRAANSSAAPARPLTSLCGSAARISIISARGRSLAIPCFRPLAVWFPSDSGCMMLSLHRQAESPSLLLRLTIERLSTRLVFHRALKTYRDGTSSGTTWIFRGSSTSEYRRWLVCIRFLIHLVQIKIVDPLERFLRV